MTEDKTRHLHSVPPSSVGDVADDDLPEAEHGDLVLAAFGHEGLHRLSDQFRMLSVAAVVEAGGDHVVVGEFSFDAAEARALAGSILSAAATLDSREALG